MNSTFRDNLPGLILLDLRKEMRELGTATCDLYAPTIDHDAMLDRVFEAIEQEKDSEQRIKEVAYDMGYHDALFEHADYEDLSPQPAIEAAITKLSHGVKNNLTNLKVYADGRLLYKFKGMLDGTTAKIVLAQDSDPGQ